MDVEKASKEIAAIFLRLTERIAVHLPHHAGVIRGDIVGVKMTSERWNRVAATCAAFSACIPGNGLVSSEYEAKAIALRLVAVAQTIARAKFGLPRERPEDLADWALRLAREVEEDAGR